MSDGMKVPCVSVTPDLKFLYTSVIHVDAPILVGDTFMGTRKIINITGGRFQGPQLSGKILPGGADWQIVRQNGVAELEARYTLATEDGAFIYVINRGIRKGPKEVMDRLAKGATVAPEEYYFRTTPVFETGAKQYIWLNDIVTVATGERRLNEVVITVYQVI